VKLTLQSFNVEAIHLGPRTGFSGGVLTIDEQELCQVARYDDSIASVKLELVSPGEETRIIHVLDAIEPRAKVGGDRSAFPGFLAPARTVGGGTTRRMQGMALLQSAQLPEPTGGILEFNEGIIDMSGPGADMCACSDTHNLVLLFTPSPGAGNAYFENAIRLGSIRASRYLVETALADSVPGLGPNQVEEFELGPADPTLPRVVYVDQVQQQGFLVQTFLYGQPVASLPTVLHPNEYFDGAVVSGNYRNMMKLPTWLRLNHPVIHELYRHHGQDINFVGVILGRGHHDDHGLKERNGYMVANVARMMGAQAAVMTLEGTGNTWVDFMQSVKALEQSGISTVQIVHELGGVDGTDWPIIDYVSEANAIVTGGGADRRFTVPAMKRVVGGTDLTFSSNEEWGQRLNAGDSLTISAHEMYAGFWMMQSNGHTARDF
jgi:sarcosine reductase